MASLSNVPDIVLSRYAGSLIDLAESSKSLKKVSDDLSGLKDVLSQSEDFAHFISTPTYGKGEQKGVVQDLAKKLKLDGLTTNFLMVLIENGRLNALPGIIETYFKAVAKRAGEVEVKIETAIPMLAKQEADVKKNIEAALGAPISLSASVEPEILGGMIITIGAYMVDDSVRRKLERLGAQLGNEANQNVTQNLKEVV